MIDREARERITDLENRLKHYESDRVIGIPGQVYGVGKVSLKNAISILFQYLGVQLKYIPSVPDNVILEKIDGEK
jgi:hypothetical protein